jgi:hypothetical protein
MNAFIGAPKEAHDRSLDSKLASSRRHLPELVRPGAFPCKILTEVPGRKLAPERLLNNNLLKALRCASGWPRRDLTAVSVFVVFGKLDFVEFLCLSQASRLEIGKERKSARSGAWALASAALWLVHAHSCCKYSRPRRGALQQHVDCSPHLSSPASLARQMHPDTLAVLSRTSCGPRSPGALYDHTLSLTDLSDHLHRRGAVG